MKCPERETVGAEKQISCVPGGGVSGGGCTGHERSFLGDGLWGLPYSSGNVFKITASYILKVENFYDMLYLIKLLRL